MRNLFLGVFRPPFAGSVFKFFVVLVFMLTICILFSCLLKYYFHLSTTSRQSVKRHLDSRLEAVEFLVELACFLIKTQAFLFPRTPFLLGSIFSLSGSATFASVCVPRLVVTCSIIAFFFLKLTNCFKDFRSSVEAVLVFYNCSEHFASTNLQSRDGEIWTS